MEEGLQSRGLAMASAMGSRKEVEFLNDNGMIAA